MAYSQYGGGYEDDQQYAYNNQMGQSGHQMIARPMVDPEAEGEVDTTL